MVTRPVLPGNGGPDRSESPHINLQGVRQELWSPTDSEPDDERIWGTQDQAQDAQSKTIHATNSNSLSDVPDTLRPGVAPTSYPSSFERDEENPWQEGDKKLEANSVEPNTIQEGVPKALIPGLARTETNPFKRKPVGGSSATPAEPVQPPPPPPTTAFSNMQISDPESNTNPWQPALGESKPPKTPSPLHSVSGLDQDPGANIWGAPPAPQSTIHSSNPISTSHFPSGRNSPNWDEDERPKPQPPALPEKSVEQAGFMDDRHAWDDVARNGAGQNDTDMSKQQSGSPDGWNLIDHEPLQEPPQATMTRQDSWENFADAEDDLPTPAAPEAQISPVPPPEVRAPTEAQVSRETQPPIEPQLPAEARPAEAPPPVPPAVPPVSSSVPPSLPPRRSNEAPPQPPRPQAKSETYQIKNINWFDGTIKKTRKSPVLVQNANGPCPLVALVNALTLSSPADATSNLVETLRTREQISINLLLEAVFDELVSSRRADSNASLPDMTDLYDFLKGLQTGMNVNPRFIPSPEFVEAHQRKSPGTQIPGTFEDTRDLKLYATFSVPLIHGWLPPQDDPAYDAFTRQGSSYDEVQSLLFREEELEGKLSDSSVGLTEPEQQLYQDIITIKSWLSTTATQLTPWGLAVVGKSIQPGSVSILFRNDHFSTLYRHPQTLELLTLVTDAGYYTHDEVVWESLTDVSGERAEFYSGDFRVVGGPRQQSSSSVPAAWYDDVPEANANANQGGWQTVQNRRTRNSNSRQVETTHSSTTAISNHEQEDRDLALALQLQEEEDERHRAAQAARRRESQLSEQFIEQQGRQGTQPSRGGRGGGPRGGGRGGAPMTPPRTTSASQSGGRGGGRTAPQQHVRPLVPPASLPVRGATTHRPADHEPGDDAPPPSYEQASKTTPYIPPAGHPSHPGSNPRQSSATDPRTSASSGFGRGGSGLPPGRGSDPSMRGRPAPGPGPGPGGMPLGPTSSATSVSSGGRQERDCIVM